MRGALVLLAVMMWAGAASAAEDVNSGNFFQKYHCSNPDSPTSELVTYAQGFAIGVMAASILSGKDETVMPYCIPENVTYGQRARVLCHYLRDTPAETHMDISILSVRAYSKAWPCKE